MLNFEEYEARHDQKLIELMASVDAAMKGEGPVPPGVAGDVVKEFKVLMESRTVSAKKDLSEEEIEIMTDEVMNRFYKLVD